MRIPPKLRHGDNLANLFEKFNTVIDYLREIRLVAGNGIRINRLPAGTTIESTATATGGTPSQPEKTYWDFNIENIGDGQWKISISSTASYAGYVQFRGKRYSVPHGTLTFSPQPGRWYYLYLVKRYTESGFHFVYRLSSTSMEVSNNPGAIVIAQLYSSSSGVSIGRNQNVSRPCVIWPECTNQDMPVDLIYEDGEHAADNFFSDCITKAWIGKFWVTANNYRIDDTMIVNATHLRENGGCLFDLPAPTPQTNHYYLVLTADFGAGGQDVLSGGFYPEYPVNVRLELITDSWYYPGDYFYSRSPFVIPLMSIYWVNDRAYYVTEHNNFSNYPFPAFYFNSSFRTPLPASYPGAPQIDMKHKTFTIRPFWVYVNGQTKEVEQYSTTFNERLPNDYFYVSCIYTKANRSWGTPFIDVNPSSQDGVGSGQKKYSAMFCKLTDLDPRRARIVTNGLRIEINNYQDMIAELRDNITTLQDTVSSLANTVPEMGSNISSLQGRVANLDRRVTALENR